MFEISNLTFDKTYGGVYACSDILDFNDGYVDSMVKVLEERFGSNRPIFSELYKGEKNSFPNYTYIAWLSSYNSDGDTDENGDEYHGKHLIIVGFTDSLENLNDDVMKLGNTEWKEHAVGFFF